jgi:hypothetical protein
MLELKNTGLVALNAQEVKEVEGGCLVCLWEIGSSIVDAIVRHLS